MNWTAPFLIVVTFVAGACGDSGGHTLAKVNGISITTGDFDAQLRVLRTVRPDQAMDQKTRDQLLDQMVKQELLVQEATARGYDNNAELKNKIKVQREQLRNELQKRIADAQAQLEQLDKAIHSKALIEALLVDYGKEKKPDKATVAEYYSDQTKRGHQLPPLAQVEEKIAEQIVLDELVKEVQGAYSIEINQETLAGHEPGI